MTQDSNKVRAILIITIALIGAVYLGVTAATAQIETVMLVIGGIGLTACILLGRKIWMVIPFLGTVNLNLMIPGAPSTLMLAQGIFLGFCTLLFLMRKLPFQLAFTELGFWTLLLSLCVFQVYARNPVGLNILGGDSLGGRPYVLFIITLVSCVILSSLKISSSDLQWILRLSIFGGLVNFALLTIGNFVPRVGVWYGGASVFDGNDASQLQGSSGVTQATRLSFVRDIARNLSCWVSAFISPLRGCFHPIWAPLIFLSFAFAAFSGYRNEFAAVGLTYLVALAYRGGAVSLVIAFFAFFTSVTCIALLNLAVPLPANVQRALSFLPGTWNEVYVNDSKESTEWRVEMWKEALLTDFWIRNKALGDGLGMTREELRYIQSFDSKNTNGMGRSGKLTLQQEFMMASGCYHSGPVITIRTIGYVGFIILVIAQIRLAVHCHRQILRARDTEWFSLTLLVGIPLIWAPFFFVFIFGDFSPAVSSYLIGSAYIRLLENNLPLPPYISVSRLQYVPLIVRRATNS